jgi:hypothetical protein
LFRSRRAVEAPLSPAPFAVYRFCTVYPLKISHATDGRAITIKKGKSAGEASSKLRSDRMLHTVKIDSEKIKVQ